MDGIQLSETQSRPAAVVCTRHIAAEANETKLEIFNKPLQGMAPTSLRIAL